MYVCCAALSDSVYTASLTDDNAVDDASDDGLYQHSRPGDSKRWEAVNLYIISDISAQHILAPAKHRSELLEAAHSIT